MSSSRKIDAVWNDFWSGGISNPLEVMEQITYLLFLKRPRRAADPAPENKANRTGEPIEPTRSSREGKDDRRPPVRGLPVEPASRTSRPARCTRSSASTSSLPADARRRGLDLRHPHEGRPVHDPDAGAAAEGGRRCSTTCRWTTATPRATSTSTCSARSPPPGRTASSARRATSSG